LHLDSINPYPNLDILLNPDPDVNPDKDIFITKFFNIYNWKIFCSKTVIYVYLNPYKNVQALLFGGIVSACLDPHPNSQSGTADPIISGSNPDPDPKHCYH
jgi:hypothetical protein